MNIELAGTESRTIECDGVVATEVARAHVPDGLSLRQTDGEVEVSLLCFAMVGLGAREPVSFGPRFDYGEALWRIGVMWRGAPAWFAPVCDLDSRMIRALGKVLVRYPVRRAVIDIGERLARVSAGQDALVIEVGTLGGTPQPAAPRPLLVGTAARVFRIPWRETPAPWRRTAALADRRSWAHGCDARCGGTVVTDGVGASRTDPPLRLRPPRVRVTRPRCRRARTRRDP